MVFLAKNGDPELFLEPNKFARPAVVEEYDDHIVFHGYQEYLLTKNDLHVSEFDVNLKNKQNILSPFFSQRYLAKRSVLDLGANAGFTSFWAYQKGAESVIAIDIDETYLQMMRDAKRKFRFDNLEIENANLADWVRSADVVIALALVHWIYSCTALFCSLDAAIRKLRQLTNYMLIVEWVSKDDPAIDFFHHIDWNKDKIIQEYNLENFEAALGQYFARYEVIGDISSTRRLYAAFCTPNEIDLSCPLPLIADKGSILSSKKLCIFNGVEYWSVIYDCGDKILKQATLDLAEREKFFLSKLNNEYFPKVIDSWSEEVYSVIVLEKIDGWKLNSPLRDICRSPDEFYLFIKSCIDILSILERNSVVHRDIRPDNIIIRNGEPVLIDFGWAISADQSYFAPEGLGAQERPTDGSFSDVYSMGMIFKQINDNRYPDLGNVIDLMTDANPETRIVDLITIKACFDSIALKSYNECRHSIAQLLGTYLKHKESALVKSQNYKAIDDLIRDQQVQIQKLRGEIADRDNRIALVSQKMKSNLDRAASLECEIKEMRRSIVWQITMRFHEGFVERAFPECTSRRKFYNLGLKGGRILVNDGPKTLFQDIKNRLMPPGKGKQECQ